ncbi:hypothetical protein WOLCODRAFT_17353 [Wolfiporia cocos MD-104 SS10]|uniref:Uncharacterized protein n=1 Tax=Wolfiporia cocos (strain MD-104) TaxID=742152 RepID=A0A2H3JI13_WOLCO|nr:hypothetical protein WOLCODRAFT_17353 [Wolfiporia cocos MD-104 SS10]
MTRESSRIGEYKEVGGPRHSSHTPATETKVSGLRIQTPNEANDMLAQSGGAWHPIRTDIDKASPKWQLSHRLGTCHRHNSMQAPSCLDPHVSAPVHTASASAHDQAAKNDVPNKLTTPGTPGSDAKTCAHYLSEESIRRHYDRLAARQWELIPRDERALLLNVAAQTIPRLPKQINAWQVIEDGPHCIIGSKFQMRPNKENGSGSRATSGHIKPDNSDSQPITSAPRTAYHFDRAIAPTMPADLPSRYSLWPLAFRPHDAERCHVHPILGLLTRDGTQLSEYGRINDAIMQYPQYKQQGALSNAIFSSPAIFEYSPIDTPYGRGYPMVGLHGARAIQDANSGTAEMRPGTFYAVFFPDSDPGDRPFVIPVLGLSATVDDVVLHPAHVQDDDNDPPPFIDQEGTLVERDLLHPNPACHTCSGDGLPAHSPTPEPAYVLNIQRTPFGLPQSHRSPTPYAPAHPVPEESDLQLYLRKIRSAEDQQWPMKAFSDAVRWRSLLVDAFTALTDRARAEGMFEELRGSNGVETLGEFADEDDGAWLLGREGNPFLHAMERHDIAVAICYFRERGTIDLETMEDDSDDLQSLAYWLLLFADNLRMSGSARRCIYNHMQSGMLGGFGQVPDARVLGDFHSLP